MSGSFNTDKSPKTTFLIIERVFKAVHLPLSHDAVHVPHWIHCQILDLLSISLKNFISKSSSVLNSLDSSFTSDVLSSPFF
ncbi:MAG: hypothetical protein ACFFG0_08975 [Candidatus Thorarchaeota archaeon]